LTCLVIPTITRFNTFAFSAEFQRVSFVSERAAADGGLATSRTLCVSTAGLAKTGIDGCSGRSNSFWWKEYFALSVGIACVAIGALANGTSTGDSALCAKPAGAGLADADTLVILALELAVVAIIVTRALVLASLNGVAIRNVTRKTTASSDATGCLASGVRSTCVV